LLIELVYAVERANNPFSADDRRATLDTFDAEDSPFEIVPVMAQIANRVASRPPDGERRPGRSHRRGDGGGPRMASSAPPQAAR
jgi:hypothetical protein